MAAGSNAMRTQLMVLDRDPQVTGMAGRPVRLLWRDRRGRVRSWVPQLFARYTDGSGMLADCPGRLGTGGERALKAAQAVAAACTDIGWNYRRLAPLDEVVAANLTWLAGYRHPRNQGRPGLMPAVLEAFARPRPLLEGARSGRRPNRDPPGRLPHPVAPHADDHAQDAASRTGPRPSRLLWRGQWRSVGRKPAR
ncbi:TnsA-like heteromeric transposase endonuclease subunit [Streptomyces sp. B21-079]|uniref:TnsA-like heteromeric transposase endonuclease subunit n=1 Tax=Streptomyces sp. B21-079 TaxID=3039409 RepID=UPI003FA68415